VEEGLKVNKFTWNTLTETMMSISSTLNQKILEFVLSAGHVTLAALTVELALTRRISVSTLTRPHVLLHQ
jgi:hypothetical protein